MNCLRLAASLTPAFIVGCGSQGLGPHPFQDDPGSPSVAPGYDGGIPAKDSSAAILEPATSYAALDSGSPVLSDYPKCAIRLGMYRSTFYSIDAACQQSDKVYGLCRGDDCFKYDYCSGTVKTSEDGCRTDYDYVCNNIHVSGWITWAIQNNNEAAGSETVGAQSGLPGCTYSVHTEEL